MSASTKFIQAAAGADVTPEGAWDLSYAYYDDPLSWDISTAYYNGTQVVTVGSQENNPRGVFFKPDGTKMYIVGAGGDEVNEYDLSTAWDVTSASFNQVFSVSAQDTIPQGLFFKPDGTKMYISGDSSNSIREYDLSTAWDVSSASYLQAFSVSGQDASPSGVFFKSDGTKMYVSGNSGSDVLEYDLSTSWDVSTASYLQNFVVSGQQTNIQDVFFKPDGTKMYIVGLSSPNVSEYDLSTAWDVSSASFVQNFSVNSEETAPCGVFFKSDGSEMYVTGYNSDAVIQYTLGGFKISAQDQNPQDLFFKPDGTKMYLTGDVNNKIYEYDLSTAWDVSSASFLQDFSVSGQEASPTDVFFKPDGTKMYVIGISGDDVNEYDLSTAWDVTSASYLQVFSVSGQETNPKGIFFKPDGTKLYIAGSSGDDVNEYDLSTAWDVTSASFLQNFSVVGQETNPNGLFFKDDGTKMYILGDTGDDVNEYDLSTAWDVSSASFVQNFSIATESDLPTGIFFKPDGTQMFIVMNRIDAIYTYSLGVQE